MGRNKKHKILTEEEIREQKLKRVLKDLDFIPDPPPARVLQVGQQVSVGNLKDTCVADALYDGKIYEIDYTDVNNNYGNPIFTPHTRNFFTWLDLVPVLENSDKQISFEQNQDLRLEFSNRSAEDLFTKFYSFGVDMNPSYQRDFVWEDSDKVELIDSMFCNVDIGKFVFVRNAYGSKLLYEILDGKQRLRAILDFYENRFQYRGKFFSELSGHDRCHFTDYHISVAELSDCSLEQKLRYFLMLNKGGKPISAKHLNQIQKMYDELVR